MFFKKKKPKKEQQIKTFDLSQKTLKDPRLQEFAKKMQKLSSNQEQATLIAQHLSRLIKANKL
ncbi:hypothetical protein OQH60_02490 [Campylobacter sp. MIT 21-1685]|uniref:hypothetical protein n=1 Tax=unclassified Campylobacter TaxID=2593542 RepID=UPI00224AA7F5|nr:MULTISPECIES: hypothetical protein [unclassified Campylobacter]MCX2682737.1 hypothetical protein [Campylobacter sp. MIT 21-1684]MCX2751117.1 hypothetical protein [Campylobacter sp. MIT 21-1682]MCX2807218.1 hypothetical protein [Campylobacter sp. MIT 21-1685]